MKDESKQKKPRKKGMKRWLQTAKNETRKGMKREIR